MLQEEIEIFQQVLRVAETTSPNSHNSILLSTITRAQKIVENVEEIITENLLRQGGSTNRARKRNWVHHKTNIVHLCNRLKEARENVRDALVLDVL
jgi:hypothetical protein